MSGTAGSVLLAAQATRWWSAGHLAYNGMMALSLALALAGMSIATYLTIAHFAHHPIACSGLGSCDYVNSTEYAKLAGVSVALLGAVAYATIAVLSAVAWRLRDASLLTIAWGVALASSAFSGYLTYIELFVIDAICMYCVASTAIVVALLCSLSATLWVERARL